MNKFQDGFSNNSYDDLLAEYSGDTLTNKPVDEKLPEQKEVKPSFAQRINNLSRQNFNNQSAQKKVDTSFEDDLSNAFKTSVKRPATLQKRNSGNTTHYGMSSSHSEPRRDGRFNVNINYNPNEYGDEQTNTELNFIDKIKKTKNELFAREDDMKTSKSTTKKSPKKNSKKNTKAKIFVKKNGKIKFNADAFKIAFINFFKARAKGFAMFAICIVVSVIVSLCLLSCVNDVLAINREPAEIEVVIPNGVTTKEAIKILDEAGLIKNRTFCYLFAQIMGVSDENYLPGVYTLSPDMGVEKMLLRFKTTIVKGRLIEVVIPEGFTIDQIFERLEKNKVCTADSLYKVLDTIDFSEEYDFIAKIDNKADRYLVLEGYMYPATYEFEQGSDPANVIRQFLNKFKTVWTEEYAAKATELGMTLDEVIRLASIIEKEGNSKEQFTQISSVLHNRLNRAGVYPTLDCDSTWDYIENNIHKRVYATADRTNYENKYWTYECIGLPAGAICNPGQSAIEAALNPPKTNNYYFRHDKKGKIYLAETYEQHQANGTKVEQANSKD